MDSKLKFRIRELPEGRSRRTIPLLPEDLGSELQFTRGEVTVRFEKAGEIIRVELDVSATVTLVCDRSLRTFEHPLKGHYLVVFRPDVAGGEDESETETSRVKAINMHELTLDIGQEVRDTLLLEVPIRKLHPDYLDEEGNPVEFETRSFGGAGERGEAVDPRWESLKKLKWK